MRLRELRLQNFRCFEDQTIVFDDYTCLVGANGAGKSTVLGGLNVFFRNTASSSLNVNLLSKEDFHRGNTADPIRITLTFGELSEAAQKDLGHYARQGKLIVSAVAKWDEVRKCADVKQIGSRMVMATFSPYFKADDERKGVEELKVLYEGYRTEIQELPKWSKKDAAREALRKYEEAHPERCETQESASEFYGATKGVGLMEKHLQWVYVPAVKDASTEQNDGNKTALGQLLDRTIRAKVNFKEPISELRKKLEVEYRKIVDDRQVILADIKGGLERRLREWASPSANVDLKWHSDPEKAIQVQEPFARISLGEDGFIGDVARLGHGMQRAFIVSMLHELAETGAWDEPTLLLGIEEPELYQHPPQAKHMASLLETMADEKNRNTQVALCTHSPYFVSAKGFERMRYIRKKAGSGKAEVTWASYESMVKRLAAAKEKPLPVSGLLAKVNQIMQPSQRELFFTKVAIFVEGIEDIAYLTTQIEIQGKMEEWRKLGCHFILCAGKNNMARLLAIAKELKIPAFSVFDSDSNAKELDGHKRANTSLLLLCGEKEEHAIPKETQWAKECVMWKTTIADEVRKEFGEAKWQKAAAESRAKIGIDGGEDKNGMFVAALLESAETAGMKSNALEKAIEAILAYARGFSG